MHRIDAKPRMTDKDRLQPDGVACGDAVGGGCEIRGAGWSGSHVNPNRNVQLLRQRVIRLQPGVVRSNAGILRGDLAQCGELPSRMKLAKRRDRRELAVAAEPSRGQDATGCMGAIVLDRGGLTAGERQCVVAFERGDTAVPKHRRVGRRNEYVRARRMAAEAVQISFDRLSRIAGRPG